MRVPSCCPAARYCDGSCCNSGLTCVNGNCEQTECYASQVQMACPGGTSKCCPPGWTCTLIKGTSSTTCCPGKVCEGIYCCPAAG